MNGEILFSMDLSPSFTAGTDFYPAAPITFDRFHIAKLPNEATVKVCKSEPILIAETKNWVVYGA
jgi:hypothetical protein